MCCRRLLLPFLIPIALTLAECGSGSPRFLTRPRQTSENAPAGPHQLQGIASYYADEFQGRTTSNGETFDMNALTGAHRTLPFNTLVRVTNLENGKSVIVRINDRGPFKDDRVIDLSLGAAKQIGMIGKGTASVSLEIIEQGSSRN